MFLFQNDDAFLVLENAVKEISRILRASGNGPLHRTWVDLPYGEEEICLLEDELLPIAQMVLDRIEEIDLKIQVEQERKWAEEYVDVARSSFFLRHSWPHRGGPRKGPFFMALAARQLASQLEEALDLIPDATKMVANFTFPFGMLFFLALAACNWTSGCDLLPFPPVA
ncbi:hypothetical protein [Synechococcus sp.]|uniref:hypothetical protein n=1 Tax=Synechococcus sp. TaxID=1131 RepID=UPI0034A31E2D